LAADSQRQLHNGNATEANQKILHKIFRAAVECAHRCSTSLGVSVDQYGVPLMINCAEASCG
jgi:hypothetical protein